MAVTAPRIALFATFATAGVAHAERVSSGGSELRGPDLVVLGRDTSVELTLRRLPAGSQLVTSAGELDVADQDGAVMRVTLKPPAQRYPQLAIIAVVARDGAVVDWLALPLAGQANTRVTTNPGADVIVRVRDREFGPVRADARGVAQVPIVVPPGVAAATSIATTGAGQREQHVSLGVRAFARTHAVCSPAGDRAFIIATELDGSPAHTPPSIVASTGHLEVAAVSPGVFVARRTNVTAEAIDVRAAFSGEETVASTCELQTPTAPPSRIELSADRGVIVAGSGAVQLRFTPRYADGARRLDPLSIAVDADVGTVSEPVRGADNAWTASWQIPAQLGAMRRARVSARALIAGGATVRSELVVELAPAAAATLTADVPRALRGDGRAQAAIRVQLADRFGNAVDGVPIEVVRGNERIATVASSPAAQFSYTAPHTYEARNDTLVLRAAGIESRAIVPLVPLPGPFELGAHAGVLTNFGRVTIPMLRLDAGRYLPLLGGRVSAHVRTGVYSTEINSPGGSETIDARLTLMPLLGGIAYNAQLASLHVRAGVGAGVALAWSRLSSPSLGTQREQDAALAGTAFAGAAYAAGPGQVVGEVAYLHAAIAGMLEGRAGGLAATLGYSIDL